MMREYDASLCEMTKQGISWTGAVRLCHPFSEDKIRTLKAGQRVLLYGEIYTARDAAHQRLLTLLDNGQPLPFKLKDQAVFYAGPCPTPTERPAERPAERPTERKNGYVIGSIGPTTSGRMDAYTPRLMAEGLRVMIGKGARNKAVLDAIEMYTGVYLAAIGGAAALMARCVVSNELIAFEDLGTEAIRRLTVCGLPLVVAADCMRGNIY